MLSRSCLVVWGGNGWIPVGGVHGNRFAQSSMGGRRIDRPPSSVAISSTDFRHGWPSSPQIKR